MNSLTGRLRRVATAFVLGVTTVATLGVFASPASAAKPITIKEHRIGFVCEDPALTNAFGTAIVVVMMSDVEDPTAGGLFWEYPATPENDEPTLRSDTGVPTVSGDATRIEASFGVETTIGTPVGIGTVWANLAPAGPLEQGENEHTGNRTIRNRTSFQPLAVTSGAFTLPTGVVFDLTGCPGFDLSIDLFITLPDSFVQTFSGVLMLCDIAGDNYFLQLAASTDANGTGGFMFFGSENGTFEGHHSDLTLTPEEFSGTFELADAETGDPAGEAVIDASLERIRRVVLDKSEFGSHSKLTGWLLGVDGTITIPTVPATVIDLTACFALDGRETSVHPSPGHERRR